MISYTWYIIIFAVVVAAIMAFIVFALVISKRKKVKPLKPGQPNAIVFDERTRSTDTRGEYIPQDDIPTASNPRWFAGKYVHLLVRHIDKDFPEGRITPLEVEEDIEPGNTPSDLYELLRCVEAPPVFCVREGLMSHPGALKLIVIVIVVFAFILFIIRSANL